MGVPALFRWLSRKYPKIVLPVVEEQPQIIEGADGEKSEIPIDMSKPNPNGEENDCLYLDMNGIVHPCTHPEGKPAPSTEAEMMMEVFKYTERVVNMARPRKVLFMAIDGVAPRAKMNQQRSRRFRAADEAKIKAKEKEEAIKEWEAMGKTLSDEYKNAKAWDTNAITPGTPFMDLLAASLRYWVAYKMNTDKGWSNLQVIISDSSVPGEGEHKIVDYIRRQRSQPTYNPNTTHVFYGLDADLIMLSLATHEPNFKILREDVFAQGQKRGCHKCGQPGHHSSNCLGISAEEKRKQEESQQASPLKPFIFLDVSILREYLQVELNVPGVSFFELERAIDDWVFMIFFVGNDFLPHLPSLDIREGAIDMLLKIWRDALPQMGGYLTNSGRVELSRAQIIMDGLASREDEIFRKRKENDERQEHADKEKRRRIEASRGGIGNNNNQKPGPPEGAEIKQTTLDFVPVLKETQQSANGNAAAAAIAPDTVKPAFVPASNPVSAVPGTQSAQTLGGPPKPKNPMFVSSRASGTAPIRNNFGLGGGRPAATNANKPAAAINGNVDSLMASSQDVVMNRAAIRKANLSAAEMLKAELAGKAKASSPTEPATTTSDPIKIEDAAAAETSGAMDTNGSTEVNAIETAQAADAEVAVDPATAQTEDHVMQDEHDEASAATTVQESAVADEDEDVVISIPPALAVEPDGTVDAVINSPPVEEDDVEEDVPESAVNGEGLAVAALESEVKAEEGSSPSKGKKRTADEAGIPGSRTQAAIEEAKEENGKETSADDEAAEDDEDDPAGDITTMSASVAHIPKPLKHLGGNVVEQEDTVQLWEPGYKERYYEQKFGAHIEDAAFRREVATHYVEGLCWVLAYYYTGCPSWTWYYPYHFAPFASDFTDLETMDINFETGTPFRPFEQLMGVFPAASKSHLPPPFQKLMTEEDSEIIDFYPEEFHVDMNGKKMLWQGVALLPFIDEKRLLDALNKKYPQLTDDENRRNSFGKDVIFVNEDHALYDQISSLYMKRKIDQPVPLEPTASKGFSGTVLPDQGCVPNSTYINPLPDLPLSDLPNDKSISAYWWMPEQIHPHTSSLLPGYKPHKRVLTPDDIESIKRGDNGGGQGGGGRDRYRRGPAGDGFHAQRRDFEGGGQRRDARDVANARGRGNNSQQFGGSQQSYGSGGGQNGRNGYGGDSARGGGPNTGGYGGYSGGREQSNYSSYGGRGGEDRDRGGRPSYGSYGGAGGSNSESRGPPPPQHSQPSYQRPPSHSSQGGYDANQGSSHGSYGGAGYGAPPTSSSTYGGYGQAGYGAPPVAAPPARGAPSSYGSSYGGYGASAPPSYGGPPPSSSYPGPPPPLPSSYGAPSVAHSPVQSTYAAQHGSYGSSSYGGPPQGYNPPPPAGYVPPPPGLPAYPPPGTSYGGPPPPAGGSYGAYGGNPYGAPPAPPQATNRGYVPDHLRGHQPPNQHQRWAR